MEFYNQYQRGIFENDIDSFRLLMASLVGNQNDEGETNKELRCLLSVGKLVVKERRKPKEWLTDSQWRNIQHLEHQMPHIFSDLSSKIFSHEKKWKDWILEESPEECLPSQWARGLTQLQQACLVYALRDDRTLFSIRNYVEKELGTEFVQSPSIRFDELAKISSPIQPIICVISPGAFHLFILLVKRIQMLLMLHSKTYRY